MKDDSATIKELLEIVKHKVDSIDTRLTGQSASISLMRDQLSVVNSKLDNHTASLMEIESKLTGYGWI